MKPGFAERIYNPETIPEAEPTVPAKWQKPVRSQQGLFNLEEQSPVRKDGLVDKSIRG
jgi:hypothetical protein